MKCIVVDMLGHCGQEQVVRRHAPQEMGAPTRRRMALAAAASERRGNVADMKANDMLILRAVLLEEAVPAELFSASLAFGAVTIMGWRGRGEMPHVPRNFIKVGIKISRWGGAIESPSDKVRSRKEANLTKLRLESLAGKDAEGGENRIQSPFFCTHRGPRAESC